MTRELVIEVLHGSHIGWHDNENYLHQKEHLFPWEKESIVPAIQHGCRAKPLSFITCILKTKMTDNVYSFGAS